MDATTVEIAAKLGMGGLALVLVWRLAVMLIKSFTGFNGQIVEQLKGIRTDLIVEQLKGLREDLTAVTAELGEHRRELSVIGERLARIESRQDLVTVVEAPAPRRPSAPTVPMPRPAPTSMPGGK